MNPPAHRQLLSDLDAADFRIGEADGKWGVVGSAEDQWPQVVFWVKAAERDGAPDRFCLRLDLDGYPSQGPTGSFWDPDTQQPLPGKQWPKGGGQVAKVFRADWQGGQMLYHPLDRKSAAASGHPQAWPKQYPQYMWHERRTVVDFLEMVHGLLNSKEYRGV